MSQCSLPGTTAWGAGMLAAALCFQFTPLPSQTAGAVPEHLGSLCKRPGAKGSHGPEAEGCYKCQTKTGSSSPLRVTKPMAKVICNQS